MTFPVPSVNPLYYGLDPTYTVPAPSGTITTLHPTDNVGNVIAANPSSTCFYFTAGTYTTGVQNITIPSNTWLLGQTGAVINGGGGAQFCNGGGSDQSGTVVGNGNTGGRIENLEVTGYTTTAMLRGAISLYTAVNAQVISCYVHGNNYEGVSLGVGCIGYNNLVTANGNVGFGTGPSSAGGTTPFSTLNPNVYNNEVYGNGTANISDNAGIKFLWCTGSIVQYNYVHDNLFGSAGGFGVWYDAYNDACQIHHNWVSGNAAGGIFWEISSGVAIHDNIVLFNSLRFGFGAPDTWIGNAGIAISDSAFNGTSTITISNNWLWGNPNNGPCLFNGHSLGKVKNVQCTNNNYVDVSGTYGAQLASQNYTTSIGTTTFNNDKYKSGQLVWWNGSKNSIATMSGTYGFETTATLVNSNLAPFPPVPPPNSWGGTLSQQADLQEDFVGTGPPNPAIWAPGYQNLGVSGQPNYTFDVNHNSGNFDLMGPVAQNILAGDANGNPSHLILRILNASLVAPSGTGSGNATYNYTAGVLASTSTQSGSGIGTASPGFVFNPTLSEFCFIAKCKFPAETSPAALWSSIWHIDWTSGKFTELDVAEAVFSNRAWGSTWHWNTYANSSGGTQWPAAQQPQTASDQWICWRLDKQGNFSIWGQPYAPNSSSVLNSFWTPIQSVSGPGAAIPANAWFNILLNHSMATTTANITGVPVDFPFDCIQLFQPGNQTPYVGVNVTATAIGTGTTVPPSPITASGGGGGGGGGSTSTAPPPGTYATPTHVQGAVLSFGAGSTTSATFTPTLPANATPGNTLLVSLVLYGGSAAGTGKGLSASLNVPAPYQQIAVLNTTNTDNFPVVGSWYVPASSVTATTSFGPITVTSTNGDAIFGCWFIDEYSGLNSTIAPDAVTTFGSGGSTNAATLTITQTSPLYTNEQCFTFFGVSNTTSQTQALTAALPGWTDINDSAAIFSTTNGELGYLFSELNPTPPTFPNGVITPAHPNALSAIMYAFQPALITSQQLATPTNVSATVNSQSIALTWSAVANADHYLILDTNTQITYTSPTNSFSANGFPPGTHAFEVAAAALNTFSQSAYSAITSSSTVSVTNPPTPGAGAKHLGNCDGFA